VQAVKAVKTVSGLLAIFIVAPIWYYLMYWLLKHADAGDLQMFLFWVYIPVGVFVRLLDRLVELSIEKNK
jgi:hypothetical protein